MANRVKGRVSIIVAIYNVAPFLRKCLDSLVNQTYQDIEILCMNDCSKDESAEILREYEEKDSRIVAVYELENVGVAAVRNKALEMATGEYLMYCDGDDWIELNACEVLVNTMKTYHPDVVMFTYFREYEDKTLKKSIYPEELIIFDEERCKQLHRRHAGIIGDELSEPQNADAICSLCTKMYLTDIMADNGIKYVDNKIIGTYGDGLVNLNYYGYIKKAVYINEYLYHYRKTNMTSQTTRYKKGFPKLWGNLYDIIQKYIDENALGEDFQEGLDNRIALGIIGLGMNELRAPVSGKEKRKALKAILSEERFRKAVKQLKISKMPLHWKGFFIFCKWNWAWCVYLTIKMMLKLKEKV